MTTPPGTPGWRRSPSASRSTTSGPARWRRPPGSPRRRPTSCAGSAPTSWATSGSCPTTPSGRCSTPSGRSWAPASTPSGWLSPTSVAAGCSDTAVGSPVSSPTRGSIRSTVWPSPSSRTPSTVPPRRARRSASASSGWLRRGSSRCRPASPAADLAGYTGRFATIWGTFDIAALGGRLVGIGPALDDPLPGLQHLAVVDADTLRVADGPGYGAPGELVRYERDAGGAVVAVRAGGGLRALPEHRTRPPWRDGGESGSVAPDGAVAR